MATTRYNDDFLTPEEEARLMAVQRPQARQQPAPMQAPQQQQPAPFDMNSAVRDYLQRQLKGRPSRLEVEDPYDDYVQAGISSSALQGIAGGMAQIGTVHGKTPDVSPYVKASQGMVGPLEKSALNLQRQRMGPQVDPRILTYLTEKQNSKLLPQRDSQGFYLQQDDDGVSSSGIKGYDAPKAPKEPKAPKPEGSDLPIDKKKEVEHLASANAGYKASKAELDAGIKEYSLALDNLKKNDTKANRDQAVRVGQSLLKILNSARGSDAVGAEEVQRLGNALSFQFANVNNPGKFWGYDFPGFFDQINSASEKINNTINSIQKQIDQNMGRSQAAPASSSGQNKGATTLKSAKDLP